MFTLLNRLFIRLKKARLKDMLRMTSNWNYIFLENATKTASVKRNGVILNGENLFKEGGEICPVE